jgi:hypothetical protein
MENFRQPSLNHVLRSFDWVNSAGINVCERTARRVRACGRRTWRANGCSSITRATGSRSWLTGSPGKSAWRKSLSPCSAPRASRSRTRAGRRGASRLDQRPCPCLRGDRRRAASARARQYEDRRHQGLSLRPPGQSHLRRDGGALPDRHFAGAAEKTPGQGQGRAGRAHLKANA